MEWAHERLICRLVRDGKSTWHGSGRRKNIFLRVNRKTALIFPLLRSKHNSPCHRPSIFPRTHSLHSPFLLHLPSSSPSTPFPTCSVWTVWEHHRLQAAQSSGLEAIVEGLHWAPHLLQVGLDTHRYTNFFCTAVVAPCMKCWRHNRAQMCWFPNFSW